MDTRFYTKVLFSEAVPNFIQTSLSLISHKKCECVIFFCSYVEVIFDLRRDEVVCCLNLYCPYNIAIIKSTKKITHFNQKQRCGDFSHFCFCLKKQSYSCFLL